jgi:hypothetical protein
LCLGSVSRSGVAQLFTEAEVMQEFRLVALRALRRFNPAFGCSLPAFLLFIWRQKLSLLAGRERWRRAHYVWCDPSELIILCESRS